MSYHSPINSPYDQVTQQRLAHQQTVQMRQATQHGQRDTRADDPTALLRLGADSSQAPTQKQASIPRTAIPENDAVPPPSPGHGRQHHQRHQFVSNATGPTSRPMTAPPVAGPALAMSALALSPVRRVAVAVSPSTHHRPSNTRHVLPGPLNPSGTGARPAPSMNAGQSTSYRCPRMQCQQLCSDQRQLDAHERIHRYEDKPLVCPYPDCTWRFDFASDVTYHLSVSLVSRRACDNLGADR